MVIYKATEADTPLTEVKTGDLAVYDLKVGMITYYNDESRNAMFFTELRSGKTICIFGSDHYQLKKWYGKVELEQKP